MKIIVTGGAGFIGKELYLLYDGKAFGGSNHLSGCTDLCRAYVNLEVAMKIQRSVL